MAMSIEEVIRQSQHRGVLAWLASRQTFWIFIAAVVACILLSIAADAFATERKLFNVTRNFAFVGIIAIGMTAVIGSGGIDLSVGSVVVLSGIVVGSTAALCFGLFNGVLRWQRAFQSTSQYRLLSSHGIDCDCRRGDRWRQFGWRFGYRVRSCRRSGADRGDPEA